MILEKNVNRIVNSPSRIEIKPDDVFNKINERIFNNNYYHYNIFDYSKIVDYQHCCYDAYFKTIFYNKNVNDIVDDIYTTEDKKFLPDMLTFEKIDSQYFYSNTINMNTYYKKAKYNFKNNAKLIYLLLLKQKNIDFDLICTMINLLYQNSKDFYNLQFNDKLNKIKNENFDYSNLSKTLYKSELRKLKRKILNEDFLNYYFNYYIIASNNDRLRSLNIGYDELNNLSRIKNYLEICNQKINPKLKQVENYINKYLVDKKIKFYERNVIFLDFKNDIINHNVLSSGEKNIVILFMLALLIENGIEEENTDFTFIIDEPDISLNILWQKDLIEDVTKILNKKAKLIVLTQSPQLVQNSQLHPYLCDITECNKKIKIPDEFKDLDFKQILDDLYKGDFK